jgi:hypothetical protein
MISRATERTSRALYLCFGGFYFAYFLERKTGDWNFLGQTFTNEEFDQALIILFSFLIVAHMIHWWADYVAYTKWFDRNTPTNSEPDEIYKMEATESPSVALIKQLREFQSMCQGQINNVKNDNLNDECSIRKLSEIIDRYDRKNSELEKLEARLGKNFSSLNFVAKFVIIGWYCLVPIGLGCFAIYHLMNH